MVQGVAIASSSIGKRAIVIGAGIAGLSAARALSDSFEEVIVLERDSLPSGPTPRPGVPQGRHPHLLLAGGMVALNDLFPGFEQDLARAGAVLIDSGLDVLYEIPGQKPLPRRTVDIHTYSMSRPLIELTIRRRVEQHGNITLRGESRVLEIVGTADASAVTGVRYANSDGSSEMIVAEVVVDATAHAAPTLAFLKSKGLPLPEESLVGIKIRYSTAIFDAYASASEFKIVATLPKAPERNRSGGLLPAENNTLQVTMVGRNSEDIPGDGEAFMAYAQQLETKTIYNELKNANLVGEIARFGISESIWRHFGRLDDFPRGLLPIGDAICRFNPIHGQGMTVALQESNMLHHLLQVQILDADPIVTLTRTFLANSEALVEDPWKMSTLQDFVYSETSGERPPDLKDKLKFQGALHRLSIIDPAVQKLLFEVRNLLKPMKVLDDPEIVRRVEEQMAPA